MKTTKRIITAAFIIFCNSFCYAQMVDVSPSRQIKYSKFIFEGNVTQQECFYVGRYGVLTCNVVQITKIYKGRSQIKLGSIKVISMQGGRVGNYTDQPSDVGPGLSKGKNYIFLGKMLTDSTMLHKMATDNSITVLLSDCISLSGNSAVWDRTQYGTLDDLYSVFKANGLRVQEEAEQNK
jgi:hypothetical protein